MQGYTLRQVLLATLVHVASYISIQNKLSWTSHVDYISHKANRFLGFLTQNLKNSPRYFKGVASYIATCLYKQLVLPSTEFGILTMQKYFIDKLK